ncbi:MAG: UbiA-like protein EboC [Bryobacteraceae bacterium]
MAPTAKPSTPQIRPRRSYIRAYLELARPANVLTAAADILAGSAAVGAWTPAVVIIASASMCLYAAGVVFNDVFDRNLDTLERPERAIPSGRASARGATLFGSLLLAVGILLGFIASVTSGAIAVAIAVTALLYDAFSKHKGLLGPMNMGFCRGLNLLLGMSAAAVIPVDRYFLMLIPVVYIAAITALSAGEVHGGSRVIVAVTMVAVIAVIAGVPLLAAFSSGVAALWAVPFLTLLAARVLPALLRAYESPEPTRIFRAVKAGVLSLVVLDSAIAAAYMGPIHGLVILFLMPLAGLLARVFAVT